MTIVEWLRSQNAELDQRLETALAIAGDPVFHDGKIMAALCRLNSLINQYVNVDESLFSDMTFSIKDAQPVKAANVVMDEEGVISSSVFHRAFSARRQPETLGARDFIRAVVELGLERGNSYSSRPFAVDLLSTLTNGGSVNTPLRESPRLQALLKNLKDVAYGDEDYQYVMALEGKTIRFRAVSTLGDFVQEGDTGLFLPRRALLSHFDDLGFFTADAINELEELLNSTTAREHDLQQFFERHPSFLRRWDHREVFPHVALSRTDAGPLIPDFILTNRETQDAAILDIKRSDFKAPKKPIIRHQKSRVRFSDAVMEARAQLLTYRRWFENEDNRRKLAPVIGMQVYQPRLIVIIGRSSEFADALERQMLRADNPDIEVATYDDIVAYARKRRIMIT